MVSTINVSLVSTYSSIRNGCYSYYLEFKSMEHETLTNNIFLCVMLLMHKSPQKNTQKSFRQNWFQHIHILNKIRRARYAG